MPKACFSPHWLKGENRNESTSKLAHASCFFVVRKIKPFRLWTSRTSICTQKPPPLWKKVKCVFRYFAVGWISLNNQSSTVFRMLWLYCKVFAPSRHIASQNLKRIANIVKSTTRRNGKEICNNALKVKSYFPSIDLNLQITQVVFGSNKHLLALDRLHAKLVFFAFVLPQNIHNLTYFPLISWPRCLWALLFGIKLHCGICLFCSNYSSI